MADHVVPHYHNNDGYSRIEIGVKKFMCVGAKPPNDHPHIFLDMGDDSEKICPYCSTHFVFSGSLKADETLPAGCVLAKDDA